MYTLVKLENMSKMLGDTTLDGQLATYFIHHLNDLNNLTLKKCMSDTSISKATIHRFYSKAGFESFNSFINVLIQEDLLSYSLEYMNESVEFDYIYINQFIEDLNKAKRIMFYGNLKDIDFLNHTIDKLRRLNKYVRVLGMWEIDIIYSEINKLDLDDVFIIVDSSLKIQNYHEMSMNNSYLVSLNKIGECNKYYIGEGNIVDFHDFKCIKLSGNRQTSHLYSLINLNKYLLDKL